MSLSLVSAYASYLVSPGESRAVAELVEALRVQGDRRLAHLLEAFWSAPEVGTGVVSEIWLGLDRPSPSTSSRDRIGTWFDPLEVCERRIAGEGEESIWISARPVRQWQFAAFAKACSWEWLPSSIRPGHRPDDFLTRDFADGNASCSDVYHEEAVLYAHFFGLFLSGRNELEHVRASWSAGVAHGVLDGIFKAWDESEFFPDVSLRQALGWSDLERDALEEYAGLGADQSRPLDERTLFRTWERAQGLGFSTVLPNDLAFLPDDEFHGHQATRLKRRPLRRPRGWVWAESP